MIKKIENVKYCRLIKRLGPSLHRKFHRNLWFFTQNTVTGQKKWNITYSKEILLWFLGNFISN